MECDSGFRFDTYSTQTGLHSSASNFVNQTAAPSTAASARPLLRRHAFHFYRRQSASSRRRTSFSAARSTSTPTASRASRALRWTCRAESSARSRPPSPSAFATIFDSYWDSVACGIGIRRPTLAPSPFRRRTGSPIASTRRCKRVSSSARDALFAGRFHWTIQPRGAGGVHSELQPAFLEQCLFLRPRRTGGSRMDLGCPRIS